MQPSQFNPTPRYVNPTPLDSLLQQGSAGRISTWQERQGFKGITVFKSGMVEINKPANTANSETDVAHDIGEVPEISAALITNVTGAVAPLPYTIFEDFVAGNVGTTLLDLRISFIDSFSFRVSLVTPNPDGAGTGFYDNELDRVIRYTLYRINRSPLSGPPIL